jgi:hypothetical protein
MPAARDLLAGTQALVVGPGDIAASLVTCAMSLTVVGCGITGKIGFIDALLLHLTVLAVPVLFLLYRACWGGELTVATLLLVGTLAGGPIGAVGTAVMALALSYQRPAARRLHDWYNTIAAIVAREHVARLRDEAACGRLLADLASSVHRLAPVLSGATIAEQQRVVGMIGRGYHADLRPVLRRALRNRNGLIRAQAAAIASRLDLAEKDRLWADAPAPPPPGREAGLEAGRR